MRETTTRALGLALAVAYAVFIGWLFVRQPQTIAQVTGGLSAAIGTYTVDDQALADGLGFFRNDMQDEITHAIAATLQIKLSAEAAPLRRHPPNLRAYEAYLKARGHWFKSTPESMARVKEFLDHAIPGHSVLLGETSAPQDRQRRLILGHGVASGAEISWFQSCKICQLELDHHGC